MNVLYVTSNSHLRSTTSTLEAVFQQLVPARLRPIMVFAQPGPWPAQLQARGIRCYTLPLDAPDRWRPVTAIKLVWPLLRIVGRHAIALIHCNEHHLYPLVRVVARTSRVPAVVSIHFAFEAEAARWLFRTPYQPAYLQFVSEAVMHDSGLDAIDAATRLGVVPNALDIDAYVARSAGWEEIRGRLGVPRDDLIVGTASAIRPRKCLEDFVELIHALRAQGAKVTGVIVGGPPFSDPAYEASLKRLIAARALEPSCLMIGNVDPVAPWLRAMDVFVSTSVVEPFGMSACEAMACGTPVVAYDAGGIAKVVHDAWCLVARRDLAGLVEKVGTLVRDPARRERMGAAAAGYVRDRYDAAVVAPLQLEVYRQVARR